jgi:hypothetical protein
MSRSTDYCKLWGSFQNSNKGASTFLQVSLLFFVEIQAFGVPCFTFLVPKSAQGFGSALVNKIDMVPTFTEVSNSLPVK